MNKKSGRVSVLRFVGFVAALMFVFISFSCKSVQNEPNGQSTDPNFLGDFDPIRLENAMALRKSFKKIKPTEIRLYFVPRTNVVEAHLRDGMNAFVLIFNEKERALIAEAASMYAAAYKRYAAGDKNAMPIKKPSAKNALNKGTLYVSWGALSTARRGNASFRTNYEFLAKDKPYFLFTAEPATDRDESDVQSPLLNLYFSPSQLEALLNITNQDVLQKEIDVLEEKAFTF